MDDDASEGSMGLLVTGAAGFIGFHTCLKLAKQGHEVYGIDNINDYCDGLRSSNPDVVAFITEKKFKEKYLSLLIKELVRYRDSIPDADDVNIDGSEEEE